MNYNGVELYMDGEKIGILVSRGYGAGWSTWNYRAMAYDKRVIDFWIKNKGKDLEGDKEAEEAFEKMGYRGVYFGGFEDLGLEFVNVGVPWQINEYDGFETLKLLDIRDFTVF